MSAWVSQTQRRSIMIFWTKIVLLSSLDLQGPKTVKKIVGTYLGFVSKAIMGGTVDCFEKCYMDARAGSYRPMMLFFVYFPLIQNKLENIRQGNADLYQKIWLVAQDWIKDLPFQGEPLTAGPQHLWHECAHWVSHTRMTNFF